MDLEETKGINFDLPKNRSNVIKVIGVGGGGSNAINYMFQQGIKGVDFVITNTDAQALRESGVPTKIQLGASLTEGLGAGANPEVGAKAAQESISEIENILSSQTKMVFITAGMGGGTGTGAAPVIAQMAKSMDILTVGIVTMPFQFEGRLRLEQAQKGLETIKDAVDALIVINNNKLREVYGNLGFKAGFAKADEVLATAARGIAEVITHHYTQNIDLKDAKTVLTNSGTAIMGSASASGSNRAQEAIVKALDSPLLNDNKITGCKNVLLLIVSGTDEITIDEIGEINDFIQAEAGNHTNIIMGVGEDTSLGNEVSVTVIATGFGQEQQNEISNTEAKKIIHSLEEEQKIVHDLGEKNEVAFTSNSFDDVLLEEEETSLQSIKEQDEPLIHMNEILYDIKVDVEVVDYEVVAEKAITNEEELELIGPNSFSLLEDEIEEETDFEAFDLEAETPLFQPLFDGVTPSVNENQGEAHQANAPTANIDNTEEEEFVFNEVSPSVMEMEVVDPETIEIESQILMDFDLPFQEKQAGFDTEMIKTQENERSQNTFLEQDFEQAALEVQFELKSETEENVDLVVSKENELVAKKEENENPFEHTINQTLASQAEKRKLHLKAFNHKFSHQYQKVEEMEKEPAYKRKGLDLDEEVTDSPSRLSLDSDSNDDLQLRSNNSFLHDNVD